MMTSMASSMSSSSSSPGSFVPLLPPLLLPTCSACCSMCSRISSLYSAVLVSLMRAITASISSLEIKQPCTRVGLPSPSGAYSISPLPISFSAPVVSRMIRDSIWLATANAIRDGIFAFMIPVITSADGRCVATTRCMPAARAFCAIRQMEFSTSLAATIIRSASSSMTMTICGST